MDNLFAEKVLGALDVRSPSRPSNPSTLCKRCKELDFHQSGFSLVLGVSDLEDPSSDCSLCKLLLGLCKQHKIAPGSTVAFDRRESTLKLSDKRELPVLSMLSPSSKAPPPPGKTEVTTSSQ